MVQKVSKKDSKDHFKIRRSSRRNTMLSRTISSRARMKQARRAELALVLDILPLYILQPWVHHLANILSVIPGYGKPHERTRNTRPLVTSGVRNLGLWDQYISECYTQPNQFTSCVSFREVQIVSSPNTTDFDFDFYFLESEELLR